MKLLRRAVLNDQEQLEKERKCGVTIRKREIPVKSTHIGGETLVGLKDEGRRRNRKILRARMPLRQGTLGSWSVM